MKYILLVFLSLLISSSVVGQETVTGSFFEQAHSSYNDAGLHESHIRQWNRLSLGLKSENNSFKIEDWRAGSSNIKNLMSVLVNGNVGIGVTNPNNPLSIKYNNGSTQIALRRADGAENFQIGVNSTSGGLFRNSSGGGDFDFQTNVGGSGMKSVLFVEGSNGNVGVGSVSPDMKFSVYNDSFNVARFHSTSTTDKMTGIRIGRGSSYADLLNTTNGFGISVGTSGGNLSMSTQNEDHLAMFISKFNRFVGIGTTNPASKLEVNGDISLVRSKKIKFLETVGGDDRAYIKSTNGENGDYNSLIFAVGAGDESMFINYNGNVGIGTDDTKGFKLGVNGDIAATKIKVALYNNWPDYVFEDSYELPTLKEVENHINEKGHLQNVPSAKEVGENGFFLEEMDSKLLQKIEELTLYTIAQEKKIEEQNEKIDLLIERLEKLESK